MLKVKFIDQLPEEVEQKMSEDLVKYESQNGVDVNYRKFSIILYDEQDQVIGVLGAYTAYAEIYIDELWVDSLHRHKGYGKKLIAELENHFKDKGFNNINLVTNQFQAPEFYQKCGYKIEFVRENIKNPMLTKTGFIKYFDNI